MHLEVNKWEVLTNIYVLIVIAGTSMTITLIKGLIGLFDMKHALVVWLDTGFYLILTSTPEKSHGEVK